MDQTHDDWSYKRRNRSGHVRAGIKVEMYYKNAVQVNKYSSLTVKDYVTSILPPDALSYREKGHPFCSSCFYEKLNGDHYVV